MVIALIPILVFIVGLLLYALVENPKLVELGRAMLWCGLLVTLFHLADKVVRIP
jgi:Na+/phosphate symporter